MNFMMHLKKFYFFILLFFIFFEPRAQYEFDFAGISSDIIILCNDMAKEDMVMEEQVGKSFITPQIWLQFQRLKEMASDTMLSKLTDHPSPVVRCYAFMGLMEKNPDLMIYSLKKHENDTSSVWYYSNCIQFETDVTELIIYKAENIDRKKLSIENRRYLKELIRKKKSHN